MQKKGTINPKSIKMLKQYKENLLETEKNFLKTKDIIDKFDFYYLLKTQIRAIDSIIKRLEKPLPNDNPKIVDDTLKIWNYLDLGDIMINDRKNKIQPSFNEIAKIQSELIKCDLYPSPKEIIKETNKKNLRKNFNLFVSNIGEKKYEC